MPDAAILFVKAMSRLEGRAEAIRTEGPDNRILVHEDAAIATTGKVPGYGIWATGNPFGGGVDKAYMVLVGSEGDFENDERNIDSGVDADGDDAAPGNIMTYRSGVVVDRTITTTGDSSHGVFVRSSGKYAKDVYIDVTANIAVSGTNSKAIKIESNSGTRSEISIGSGTTIAGTLEFGPGDDILDNEGTINGDVMFSTGNNEISGGGTISGRLTGNLAAPEGLDLSANSSNHNITFVGTSGGIISFGDGDDTATVAGTVNELNLGAGNNQLIVQSGMISRALGVNVMRKTTTGVATVGALSFRPAACEWNEASCGFPVTWTWAGRVRLQFRMVRC